MWRYRLQAASFDRDVESELTRTYSQRPPEVDTATPAIMRLTTLSVGFGFSALDHHRRPDSVEFAWRMGARYWRLLICRVVRVVTVDIKCGESVCGSGDPLQSILWLGSIQYQIHR